MTIRSMIYMVAATFLLLGPAACSKTGGGGPASLGTMTVNGPGIDGVLYKGVNQFYTMSTITAGVKYTLRTVMTTSEQLSSDGTTTVYLPDGSLNIKVYSSEAAYKSNPLTPEVEIDIGEPNEPSVFEKSFIAQASGDYVAVLSGNSDTLPGKQFFYDLRLMSADASVLTSFSTTTIPAYGVQSSFSAGYLNIYDLSTVTSLSTGATFTISLVTDSTTTGYFPQLYLYNHDSLAIDSLQLSSIPTATEFYSYCVNNSAACSSLVTSATDTYLTSQATDTYMVGPVTLTSSVPGVGPYLVIRGMYSSLSYTVTISQDSTQ